MRKSYHQYKMDKPTSELGLPGFRFHPTEEELVDFYLKKVALGKRIHAEVIGFLNIYDHEPWDLPGLAKIGEREREWYFFVPRDKRTGHGGRPNRTTEKGYWKATGSDRPIRCLSEPKRLLGLRKTLVFYTGRAPRGCRTDWIMNEFRLPSNCSLPKEDIVLSKVYRKATSLKVLEQRAATGEVACRVPQIVSSRPQTPNTIPFCDLKKDVRTSLSLQDNVYGVEEEEKVSAVEVEEKELKVIGSSSLRVGSMKEKLTELQVPMLSVDWNIDPLWSQLRSPWLDNWNLNAMW